MSHGTSSICVLCNERPSITSCEGCQRKFCIDCLNKHRNELSLELDDLCNRRNELLETINNQLPTNSTDRCHSFDEIDRWQNEMHANTDRIARAAREHIREILATGSQTVRSEFDEISRDLQQKQKTGGYVEGDLQRLKQQLLKLNDTIRKSNEEIQVDTTNSRNIDWNALVSVRSNRVYQSNARTPSVPPSPGLYSSHHHQSNDRRTMPQQPFYPNTTPFTSTPYATNLRRPNGRSASIGGFGLQPRTYTCVGCKSTNDFHENARNVCSVCRSPAPF